MNSISRKLEQSLARGPVPRNDLLEKETINKQLVLVDLLATEYARFAQEIQGMETSLAEERQARLQAEQRAGEATALMDREAGKLRAREQDMHKQMQVLTDLATAAKVTAAALEAELSAVRAGMTQERAYSETERQARLSLENRLREAMQLLAKRSEPEKIVPPSYGLKVVAHDAYGRISKIELTPK
jgi:CRISPR/Cas system-associated protein Csx1